MHANATLRDNLTTMRILAGGMCAGALLGWAVSWFSEDHHATAQALERATELQRATWCADAGRRWGHRERKRDRELRLICGPVEVSK